MIPTVGRDTLGRAVRSAHGADQLLIVPDLAPGETRRSNRLRDQGIREAAGDWIMFLDDDDRYVPGLFGWIRDLLTPGWHVFRMRYPDGRTLWKDRKVHMGNVGTPMIVVPNRPDLPGWAAVDVYEADFHFAAACQRLLGEPVWHPEVICDIRP